MEPRWFKWTAYCGKERQNGRKHIIVRLCWHFCVSADIFHHSCDSNVPSLYSQSAESSRPLCGALATRNASSSHYCWYFNTIEEFIYFKWCHHFQYLALLFVRPGRLAFAQMTFISHGASPACRCQGGMQQCGGKSEIARLLPLAHIQASPHKCWSARWCGGNAVWIFLQS